MQINLSCLNSLSHYDINLRGGPIGWDVQEAEGQAMGGVNDHVILYTCIRISIIEKN